jgi:hypothetical protein
VQPLHQFGPWLIAGLFIVAMILAVALKWSTHVRNAFGIALDKTLRDKARLEKRNLESNIVLPTNAQVVKYTKLGTLLRSIHDKMDDLPPPFMATIRPPLRYPWRFATWGFFCGPFVLPAALSAIRSLIH